MSDLSLSFPMFHISVSCPMVYVPLPKNAVLCQNSASRQGLNEKTFKNSIRGNLLMFPMEVFACFHFLRNTTLSPCSKCHHLTLLRRSFNSSCVFTIFFQCSICSSFTCFSCNLEKVRSESQFSIKSLRY